jgi:large subunit ribosomal protein L9
MKVVLTKDVAGLGRAADVKEVSDGYARNFLIPKHLALPATSAMLDKIQKEQQEQQQKVAKIAEQAEALKYKLEKMTFTLKAKAGKQHLFAQVHEKEIAEAINKKTEAGITPDQIKIPEPIKSLGLAHAEVALSPHLKAKIKIDVKPLD